MNVEFEISGTDNLYKRMRKMVDFSADNASIDDLTLMAIFKPSLNSGESLEDEPWERIAIPGYSKLIHDDPLFDKINVEIHAGYSSVKGEFASVNAVFWFHSAAEQSGMSKDIVVKAPQIADQMKHALQSSTIELSLADISESGDRELKIRDVSSGIKGSIYFWIGENDTEDGDIKGSISFNLSLPRDGTFIEAIDSVQHIIREGMCAVYTTMNITPSPDMNVEMDFTKIR